MSIFERTSKTMKNNLECYFGSLLDSNRAAAVVLVSDNAKGGPPSAPSTPAPSPLGVLRKTMEDGPPVRPSRRRSSEETSDLLKAAIAVVNESRPTPRARHVEIQHFAIQEWRNNGDIVLSHCPGVINSSDDLTKALGWVLHARHARRSVGHYKTGSPEDSSLPVRPPMLEQELHELGRVLEPNS